MRTLNARQLTIEEDPYRIVVNARVEHRAGPSGQLDSYRVSAIISRIDGAAVYKNFILYNIPEGGAYLDLNGALNDGERIARQAIADGFPD